MIAEECLKREEGFVNLFGHDSRSRGITEAMIPIWRKRSFFLELAGAALLTK